MAWQPSSRSGRQVSRKGARRTVVAAVRTVRGLEKQLMISPSARPHSVEAHSSEAGRRAPVFGPTIERNLPVQAIRGRGLFVRSKAIFALLETAYSEWTKDKVPRMGAALAYYTIFSLAPLLIIVIAIAGLAFGVRAAQGEVAAQIQGLIGQDGGRAIQTMIQTAHKPVHGVIASVIAVFALFIGASGVFGEMQDAMNSIWHVDPGA